MSSFRDCAECGAVLGSVDRQMRHWDWHRSQRARLTQLEQRIEQLGAAAGLRDDWEREERERRGSE